jgi:hypothetical protein
MPGVCFCGYKVWQHKPHVRCAQALVSFEYAAAKLRGGKNAGTFEQFILFPFCALLKEISPSSQLTRLHYHANQIVSPPFFAGGVSRNHQGKSIMQARCWTKLFSSLVERPEGYRECSSFLEELASRSKSPPLAGARICSKTTTRKKWRQQGLLFNEVHQNKVRGSAAFSPSKASISHQGHQGRIILLNQQAHSSPSRLPIGNYFIFSFKLLKMIVFC